MTGRIHKLPVIVLSSLPVTYNMMNDSNAWIMEGESFPSSIFIKRLFFKSSERIPIIDFPSTVYLFDKTSATSIFPAQPSAIATNSFTFFIESSLIVIVTRKTPLNSHKISYHPIHAVPAFFSFNNESQKELPESLPDYTNLPDTIHHRQILLSTHSFYLLTAPE